MQTNPKLLQKIINANLGLFVLFIFTQVVFPNSEIISYLFLIICGIYIASFGALLTYYSWKLDSENFKLWVDQSLSTGTPKLRKYKLSDLFGHGFTRIFSLIFTFGGILVIVFMIGNIIKLFSK